MNYDMFKKISSLLLPVLFMAGCTSEDLSECGVLRLDLHYTMNGEHLDRLSGNVGDVRIYVFDSNTKLLVRVIEPTPQDIARGYSEIQNPTPGKFTFVAWAGSGDDIHGSGFMEVEMDDPENHNFRDLWDDDETLLDDFYIMLEHDVIDDPSIVGDKCPKGDFVDLFHARVEDFEVVQAQKQTVEFDFMRNTNVLNITVTGLESLNSGNTTRAEADAPVGLFVTGRNGRYKWDNTIDPYARLVRYEPTALTRTETDMESDIKTLHLNKERHADDPVLLYIVDPATGDNLHQPIDIIEAIGQVKDEDGNYLYRTQEDIDRAYTFPILVEISDEGELVITISIDGWKIVFPEAGLM